jgi:hypothetical protein
MAHVAQDNLPRTIRGPLLIFGGAIILLLFVVRGLQPQTGQSPPSLSARPATSIGAARTNGLPAFDQSIADEIRQKGFVTVTVHVGLFHHTDDSHREFARGDDPENNFYWGALFGFDTHFANAAGWRRAFRDRGEGRRILARSVFHKRVEPTEHWIDRGVENPFDIFVLANAWNHTEIVHAMEQPIRAALCRETTTIKCEGRSLGFDSDSVIVGYVGPNHMLEEYWDPLVQLGHCRPTRRIGVFYACPRSAVVLHMPLIDAGLYPVLFTRNTITPEAYVVDGILDALLIGDLDDGFIDSAATQYARYQKGIDIETARNLFVR